ncbi:type II toxin-antitoxin system Phd/YefM family antitoxin [Nonomuraea dietziae]|jgi:PHD/YefM family antitoxin component YafN of YafNO toxin-antitoxin module|uniref:Antitoxin n=1 Tax=Nonomuraea dietziae TaxID=65515 RepID=A0A7W5VAN9_9ACTN|nr:type II toxin-antitoxin system Phd/YefM family antitoxin [Nonomuraea dietziae]MBB3733756.1 PHD/YefM family antitoxin component YafN of YafNO toxin-antitoxin module [Nonomuraea dietziae]
MTIDQTSMETLGIAAARDKLGPLVSRAVMSHRPTRIKRSDEEHAVLISEEAFEEYLRLKREREAADLRELMAAAGRGEIEMTVYDSREAAYADLGLDGTDQ